MKHYLNPRTIQENSRIDDPYWFTVDSTHHGATMEILLKGIDSSQNKLLANALGQHGHAVSHCTDIVNAHKILDRKIWELEIVICQIDTAKPTEALKFAEYITEAKIQRGYYDKPFIILLISGRIDEPL